jgi:hypothetical protein
LHPHWLDANEPSPKDIALAHYSEVIHFIVTLSHTQLRLSGHLQSRIGA